MSRVIEVGFLNELPELVNVIANPLVSEFMDGYVRPDPRRDHHETSVRAEGPTG